MKKCLNCDQELEEKDKYCSNCGQFQEERVTFSTLFQNVIGNFFSVDSRFFKSILPLLFLPAFLAEKYAAGKRKTYLHPVKFYFFSSIIFFLLLSNKTSNVDTVFQQTGEKLENAVFKLDSLEVADSTEFQEVLSETDSIDIKKISKFSKPYIDSVRTAGGDDMAVLRSWNLKPERYLHRFLGLKAIKFIEKSGVGLTSALISAVTIAIFFMIPLFAFLAMLFNYGRRNFGESLVFAFYEFSFQFLLFSLFLAIVDEHVWILLFLAISLLHVFIALKRFYENSFLGGVVKTSFILLLYNILVLPLALIIILSFTVFYY